MERINQIIIAGNNLETNKLIESAFRKDTRNTYTTMYHFFEKTIAYLSEKQNIKNLENGRVIMLVHTDDIESTIQFLESFNKISINNNIYIMAVETQPVKASFKKVLDKLGVYCFVSGDVPVHALDMMVPNRNTVMEATEDETETEEVNDSENTQCFSYGGFMNIIY